MTRREAFPAAGAAAPRGLPSRPALESRHFGSVPSPERPRFGVYCLANDAVLEWFLAFAESLRATNPDVELCLIPFDDRTAALRRIADRYGFSIWDDGELLSELDTLGPEVTSGSYVACHAMRKLAVFSGPFDRFAFFDADVVVLEPLAPLADRALAAADFVFFDLDIDQVYEPGPLRERIAAEHGACAANTGAFISRRGLLDLPTLRQRAAEAAVDRAGFVQRTLEQPFFVYCLDVGDVARCAYRQVDPEVRMTWARQVLRQEGAKTWALEPDGGCHRVPLVHWAGFGLSPEMPNWRIYRRFRVRAEREFWSTARCWWHLEVSLKFAVAQSRARRVARFLLRRDRA